MYDNSVPRELRGGQPDIFGNCDKKKKEKTELDICIQF